MLDPIPTLKPRDRRLLLLAGLAGAALAIIGIRFLAWPDAALRFFGLPPEVQARGLAAVVGFRDLWLGGLAVAFAFFREWRALALWLMFGALVCFADAALVAASGAKMSRILFHSGSGVFCAVLGAATWARAGRPRP